MTQYKMSNKHDYTIYGKKIGCYSKIERKHTDLEYDEIKGLSRVKVIFVI